MKGSLSFSKYYFLLALFLFIVEVLIAMFVEDNFVRPYFGDFLVVILIYCAIRTFYKNSLLKVCLFVLMFAYLIELLQYFKFVKLIGLEKSKLANVVIGNSFAWSDMIAYTLGIITVFYIEKLLQHKQQIKDSNNTTFQVKKC